MPSEQGHQLAMLVTLNYSPERMTNEVRMGTIQVQILTGAQNASVLA